MSRPSPEMGTADDAFGDRLIAYLIDFALLSVGVFVVWIVAFVLQMVLLGATGSFETGEASAAGGVGALAIRVVLWAVIGALVFGYFTYFDGTGRTFGKRFRDVVVAKADGSMADKKAAAIRTAVLLLPLPVMALLGVLLSWLGFVLGLGLMAGWLLLETLVMVASDDKRRLGDRAAGTVVVRAADGDEGRSTESVDAPGATAAAGAE